MAIDFIVAFSAQFGITTKAGNLKTLYSYCKYAL